MDSPTTPPNGPTREPGSASGGRTGPRAPAGLDQSLNDLAQLAERNISGADGVGITVVRDGRVVALAASNPFVLAVDAVQYRLHEGPCVTAVADNLTVSSPWMDAGETRWPAFREGIQSLGLRSVVSTPLTVGGDVLGSMNVYANVQDAFPRSVIGDTEYLASVAALAVSHAYVLTSTGFAAGVLQDVSGDRAVVDLAIGILMAQAPGTSREAARATLLRLCADQGLSPAAGAAQIVARHTARYPDES